MVDARPQCSHFLLTLRRMFAHIPCAQPDGRHCLLLAEAYCFFTIFSSLTVCTTIKQNRAQGPVLMHEAYCKNAQSEGVGDPGGDQTAP